MSKHDTLNTVVNTLTYLEVSSANKKLNRLEAQQNREFMQARAAAYQHQRAIDQVYGLQKQFETLATSAGVKPIFRYLQAELLVRDLEQFDEFELGDLESRKFFLNLEKKATDLKSELGAQVGGAGQVSVQEFIELPPLIESTKLDHVYVEALSAAEGAWLSSRFVTAIMILMLLGVAAAVGLAYSQESSWAFIIDGNLSYRLAPLLVWGGVAGIGALTLLRFFARAAAKGRIRRACKCVGITTRVPLLSKSASAKRAGENVSRSIKLGSDRGPYAIDARTKKSLLDGISTLEKRFAAAQAVVFSND